LAIAIALTFYTLLATKDQIEINVLKKHEMYSIVRLNTIYTYYSYIVIYYNLFACEETCYQKTILGL
jgi:hypothetical protein